jgi:hypothetical protein
VEARRQAGEADVLERGAVLGAHGARGSCGEGAGRVDDVRVAREVEAARAVAGGGHVGRGGFFLDDNLGCLRTPCPGRRLAVR